MSPERKLPILNESLSDHDARPPWHWIPIGAGFVLALWLPLLIGALHLAPWLVGRVLDVPDPAAAERLMTSGADRALLLSLTLGPVLASFALAAGLAGALVGRFGTRARPTEAALAGLTAALGITLLAALGGELSSLPLLLGAVVVLSGLGTLATWVGARLAQRQPPGDRRRVQRDPTRRATRP